MLSPQFTIGIEEEFQVINSQGILTPVPSSFFGRYLKKELLQACGELVTDVHEHISTIRQDLASKRSQFAKSLSRYKLYPISSGLYPFALEQRPLIMQEPHILALEQGELGSVIYDMWTFGLHVHIGIPRTDQDALIQVFNHLRQYLPLLLAFSAYSPIWQGEDTGFASKRAALWRSMPRTGIPDTFNSWKDFESYRNLLFRTGKIDKRLKFWWDLLVHPHFNTLEFRICDMPETIWDTLGIIALALMLTGKVYREVKANKSLPSALTRALIEENKWEALRFGLDGTFVDFNTSRKSSMRDALRDLFTNLEDIAKELGCQEELRYMREKLRLPSASRMLAHTFKTEGSKGVVDTLIGNGMKYISAEGKLSSFR